MLSTLLDNMWADLGINPGYKVDSRGLTINYNLPGYGKEDVKVSASENRLIVRSAKEDEHWSRTIPINRDYNIKKTSVKLLHGVMTITIPRGSPEDEMEINIE